MQNLPTIIKPEVVKTGRKLTKFVCNICGKEKIVDKRKRDKHRSKFLKHIRDCKG